MSRESDKDTINEMEQIQRGLEAFLEQELREMRDAQADSQQQSSENTENVSIVEQNFDDNIGEEQEIEMVKKHNNENKNYTQRRRDDDYVEDWDSPKHCKRSERRAQHETPPGKKGNHDGKKGKSDDKKSNGRKHKESVNVQGKPKKRKKKSRFLRFLIFMLVILALLAGGLYYLVGAVYGKMHYAEIESVTTAPIEEEGVINVLLIGNDSRSNGEDGRSDAMILLSISEKTKKIYMTSLLRDMYVEIPGYKNNRLNAAYSFGGAELLMETVEQNFDIEVNRYVSVNFEAFANLIDAVGGVELELTAEEIEYVNGYLVEYNMLTSRPQGTDNMDASTGGLVHLNGPQALAYTRNRYLGTDFGRTERQRKVLEAAIKKLPAALVSNPKGLIGEIMPNLTTNFTQKECYSLSLKAAKYLTYDIVQSSIPLEGTYSNATIRDMAVLEVDFETNKQFIRENIYGEGLVQE